MKTKVFRLITAVFMVATLLAIGTGIPTHQAEAGPPFSYCGEFEVDFGGDVNAKFYAVADAGPFVILHGIVDLMLLDPSNPDYDGPVFFSGTGQKYGDTFMGSMTLTQQHLYFSGGGIGNCWRDGAFVQMEISLTPDSVTEVYSGKIWAVGISFNPCEDDDDPDSQDGLADRDYFSIDFEVVGKLPKCMTK